ncbi:hypothetical protein [Peribacillus frigoritolerans]|uniref:hypothetical protein n=1 Tax=Peribacillus frigoritolerans TaxID=450367 RepID=UPI0035E37EF9
MAGSRHSNVVLGTIVTTANTHDSHTLKLFVELGLKVRKREAVAADAAYKAPAITSYLFNKVITPALPYTLPQTKEGFFMFR